MATRQRLGFLLATVIHVALVHLPTATVGVAPALAQGLPPNFNTRSDILLGQRLLLEVDDIVISARDSGNELVVDHAATSNLAITSQFQVPPGVPGTNLPLTVKGRPFNTPSDTVLNILSCTSCVLLGGVTIEMEFAVNFSNQSIFVASTNLSSSELPPGLTQVLGAAMADFNGDGYDDLVLWYQTSTAQYMQILTAADVNNANAGLVQATWTQVVTTQAGSLAQVGFPSQLSLAVADFNGDGVPDIARVAVVSDALSVVFDTVTATSLVITAGQLQSLGIMGSSNVGMYAAATAGEFNGNPIGAELMVLVGGKPPAMAVLVSVNAALAPTVAGTVNLPNPGNSDLALPQRIASGRLNASACGAATPCADQAVVLYVANAIPTSSPPSPFSIAAIVAFDPMQAGLFVASSPASTIINAARSARWTSRSADSLRARPTSSGRVYNFDLQVAVLGNVPPDFPPQCTTSGAHRLLAIYNVVSSTGFLFQLTPSAARLNVDLPAY